MILRSVCTLLLLGTVACGSANSLEGSIEESFSLEFDRVQIRKQGEDLLVEYLRDRNEPGEEGITDKVVKLVVDTEGLGLADDTVIEDRVFLERVDVLRVAKPEGDFPEVTDGKVEFDKFEFEDGGRIKGNFDCIFEGGTNLSGKFSATVEEVDAS